MLGTNGLNDSRATSETRKRPRDASFADTLDANWWRGVVQTRYQPNERRGRRRLRYGSTEADQITRSAAMPQDEDVDLLDDQRLIIEQQPLSTDPRATGPSASNFVAGPQWPFGAVDAQFSFRAQASDANVVENVNPGPAHQVQVRVSQKQAADTMDRTLSRALGRLTLQAEADIARTVGQDDDDDDDDDDANWGTAIPRALNFGPRLQPQFEFEFDETDTIAAAQSIVDQLSVLQPATDLDPPTDDFTKATRLSPDAEQFHETTNLDAHSAASPARMSSCGRNGDTSASASPILNPQASDAERVRARERGRRALQAEMLMDATQCSSGEQDDSSESDREDHLKTNRGSLLPFARSLDFDSLLQPDVHPAASHDIEQAEAIIKNCVYDLNPPTVLAPPVDDAELYPARDPTGLSGVENRLATRDTSVPPWNPSVDTTHDGSAQETRMFNAAYAPDPQVAVAQNVASYSSQFGYAPPALQAGQLYDNSATTASQVLKEGSAPHRIFEGREMRARGDGSDWAFDLTMDSNQGYLFKSNMDDDLDGDMSTERRGGTTSTTAVPSTVIDTIPPTGEQQYTQTGHWLRESPFSAILDWPRYQAEWLAVHERNAIAPPILDPLNGDVASAGAQHRDGPAHPNETDLYVTGFGVTNSNDDPGSDGHERQQPNEEALARVPVGLAPYLAVKPDVSAEKYQGEFIAKQIFLDSVSPTSLVPPVEDDDARQYPARASTSLSEMASSFATRSMSMSSENAPSDRTEYDNAHEGDPSAPHLVLDRLPLASQAVAYNPVVHVHPSPSQHKSEQHDGDGFTPAQATNIPEQPLIHVETATRATGAAERQVLCNGAQAGTQSFHASSSSPGDELAQVRVHVQQDVSTAPSSRAPLSSRSKARTQGRFALQDEMDVDVTGYDDSDQDNDSDKDRATVMPGPQLSVSRKLHFGSPLQRSAEFGTSAASIEQARAITRRCLHDLDPPTVPLLPLDDAKLDLVHDSNDLHRTSTIATMRGMSVPSESASINITPHQNIQEEDFVDAQLDLDRTVVSPQSVTDDSSDPESERTVLQPARQNNDAVVSEQAGDTADAHFTNNVTDADTGEQCHDRHQLQLAALPLGPTQRQTRGTSNWHAASPPLPPPPLDGFINNVVRDHARGRGLLALQEEMKVEAAGYGTRDQDSDSENDREDREKTTPGSLPGVPRSSYFVSVLQSHAEPEHLEDIEQATTIIQNCLPDPNPSATLVLPIVNNTPNRDDGPYDQSGTAPSLATERTRASSDHEANDLPKRGSSHDQDEDLVNGLVPLVEPATVVTNSLVRSRMHNASSSKTASSSERRMRRAQGRRLLQAELSGDKSDDDDTISLSGALPPITGSPVRINAVSVVDYSIESGDYRDARYAYIYGDDECPEDVDESYGADSRHIPGDEDYRTDGDDHGDDHYGSDDGYGLDDYLSPNDVDQHTGTDDGHLGADDEFDLDYYEQYLSEDDLERKHTPEDDENGMEVDSPVKGKPTTMSNDDVDFAAALVQQCEDDINASWEQQSARSNSQSPAFATPVVERRRSREATSDLFQELRSRTDINSSSPLRASSPHPSGVDIELQYEESPLGAAPHLAGLRRRLAARKSGLPSTSMAANPASSITEQLDPSTMSPPSPAVSNSRRTPPAPRARPVGNPVDFEPSQPSRSISPHCPTPQPRHRDKTTTSRNSPPSHRPYSSRHFPPAGSHRHRSSPAPTSPNPNPNSNPISASNPSLSRSPTPTPTPAPAPAPPLHQPNFSTTPLDSPPARASERVSPVPVPGAQPQPSTPPPRRNPVEQDDFDMDMGDDEPESSHRMRRLYRAISRRRQEQHALKLEALEHAYRSAAIGLDLTMRKQVARRRARGGL